MNKRKTCRATNLLAILIAITSCLSIAQPACADELRSSVKGMCELFKKYLDGRELDSIVIGEFNGPAALAASGGVGIKQMLTEEFETMGVSVKTRGPLALSGRYRLIDESAIDPLTNREFRHKFMAITIECQLEDVTGQVISSFDFDSEFEFDTPKEFTPTITEHGIVVTPAIKDESVVTELIGVNTILPPAEPTDKNRAEKLRNSIVDPQCHIDGTTCSVTPDSLLAVEILVNGQPMSLKIDEGLPFVGLQKDDIYSVKVYNRGGFDAAIKVKIDGLSSFCFSEDRFGDGARKGQPTQSYYFIPGGKSGVIPGWYKKANTFDSFKITGYSDSAAGSLNQTTGIGTITVSYSAAWEGNNIPIDEANIPRNDRLATGRGPTITQQTKSVKRNVGVLRESISIRYHKNEQ